MTLKAGVDSCVGVYMCVSVSARVKVLCVVCGAWCRACEYAKQVTLQLVTLANGLDFYVHVARQTQADT